LILAVVISIALYFAIGRVDTLIANHDNANLQQAKVVAVAQADKTQALATQAAQQAAQFQAETQRVAQQNAALEQANATLVAALTKQQKTDAVMTTPEIAQRWTQLVPAATVSSAPTGGVTLTDAGAHATVNELEKVPVLTAQLVDAQQETKNEQGLLSLSTGQVTTLNAEVGSLKLQLVDNDKVCKADIATVKAEARRSKRRWFAIGFVAGWASRQVVKTYTGL
jgi:cytoskeletal protein RodZ